MPANVNSDIREYLDMMIGCLREMQIKLYRGGQEAETNETAAEP